MMLCCGSVPGGWSVDVSGGGVCAYTRVQMALKEHDIMSEGVALHTIAAMT